MKKESRCRGGVWLEGAGVGGVRGAGERGGGLGIKISFEEGGAGWGGVKGFLLGRGGIGLKDFFGRRRVVVRAGWGLKA